MSVTYRITPTNENVSTQHCNKPHKSERSYTIEALGGDGTIEDACAAFWSYLVDNRLLVDVWNNPIADGGVQITEESESRGRLWNGRVSWETTSSSSSASQLAQEGKTGAGSSGSGDGGGSQSSPFSWYPFIASFSTAGGTMHMPTSYATRIYDVDGTAPDFNGGIGWNGEVFEGVDVPCPSITFDVTVRTPMGFVANFGSYLSRTLPFVATVNERSFYGCAAGTVLFNGITSGTLKTGTAASGASFPYWEMNFNFSALPNTIANVCGVAVPKGGWEYLWTYPEGGTIVGAYVETVFRSSDFSLLGCGGGF